MTATERQLMAEEAEAEEAEATFDYWMARADAIARTYAEPGTPEHAARRQMWEALIARAVGR